MIAKKKGGIVKIIIGCEFSQVVCKAFREKGHEAYSCDIIPCEGGHSEWHIQDDILNHLNDGWDMAIFHDPCTYQCNSGVSWLNRRPGRWEELAKSIEFTNKLLDADIEKICRENPIPHKFALQNLRFKYTQIIQPWQFGHAESKATCLWLKNLPILISTNIIEPPEYCCKCGMRFNSELGKYGCPDCCGDNGAARLVYLNQTPSGQNKLTPGKNRGHERSRTYPGIAKAMANQWG